MNQPLLQITIEEIDEKTQALVRNIVEAADDRKAADIVILKVTEVCYLSDYFILLSGFSKTQVRAICDSIEEKVEVEYARKPIRVEGKNEASWILMDYGEIIVHIFLPTEREFYNLEAFWGHATRVPFGGYAIENLL
jgi:ribosome-associated protein